MIKFKDSFLYSAPTFFAIFVLKSEACHVSFFFSIIDSSMAIEMVIEEEELIIRRERG